MVVTKINGKDYKYILTEINGKEYAYPDISEQITLWNDYYKQTDRHGTNAKKILQTLWDMALDYASQRKETSSLQTIKTPITIAQYKEKIIQLAYSISLKNVSLDLTFGSYGKAIDEVTDKNLGSIHF